jgi:hypothetical protein
VESYGTLRSTGSVVIGATAVAQPAMTLRFFPHTPVFSPRRVFCSTPSICRPSVSHPSPITSPITQHPSTHSPSLCTHSYIPVSHHNDYHSSTLHLRHFTSSLLNHKSPTISTHTTRHPQCAPSPLDSSSNHSSITKHISHHQPSNEQATVFPPIW